MIKKVFEHIPELVEEKIPEDCQPEDDDFELDDDDDEYYGGSYGGDKCKRCGDRGSYDNRVNNFLCENCYYEMLSRGEIELMGLDEIRAKIKHIYGIPENFRRHILYKAQEYTDFYKGILFFHGLDEEKKKYEDNPIGLKLCVFPAGDEVEFRKEAESLWLFEDMKNNEEFYYEIISIEPVIENAKKEITQPSLFE